MLFWAVMWIYVFTPLEEPLPPREVLESVLKVNTALAYTYLGVLSMSSVAVGLAQHKLASSSAVAFTVRFTRLSPAKYLIEDFSAGLAAVISYVAATVAAVTGLSYLRFGVLTLPENPAALLAYLTLAGTLWYWISYLLSLAMIVFRKPRSQLLSMVPLLIGFGIYATMWVDPGSSAYLIPIAPLVPLIVNAASGAKPLTGGWLIRQPRRGVGSLETVDPSSALLATAAWILSLATLSLLLLRRVTGVPVEEVAQTG